jgi:hypothetical protein
MPKQAPSTQHGNGTKFRTGIAPAVMAGQKRKKGIATSSKGTTRKRQKGMSHVSHI